MATVTGQTFAQLINSIQLQTLADPTPPAPGSQEYLTYANLIGNLAIPVWENERGTLWEELWVPVTNAATITAGMTSISLPKDYKFMWDGIVNVTYPTTTTSTTPPPVRGFPVHKLSEIGLDVQGRFRGFYPSGNQSAGYQLNFGWTPQVGDAEIGAKISYRYYKRAIVPVIDPTSGTMTNANAVPEMADPGFIIFKVSAQVSASNYNTTMYSVMEDKANYSLLQMRMANDMSANYMDDYVKDIDGLIGGGPQIPNRYNSGYWNGQ